MFRIVAATLLLMACLFEAPNPVPPKTEGTTPQATSNQKLHSVNWEVHIPFVGCENGKPVVNVDIPDQSAPTPICPGAQPPDVLPQNPVVAGISGQDGEYETGTVIAIGVSHEKISIAADSRNVLITQRRLTDGTVETKRKYDDCACKLVQLTPTLLFAADGQVSATKAVPAGVVYDAHELARLAARNYRPDPQEEELAGGMIEAIAARWAWDIDFQMHHAFASGWRPIDTLEGIFAGLESDGEIAFVVAKLEYPRPRNGFHTPPVSFTVGTMKLPPTDYTWVEAFGINDVAKSYYLARAATDQTRAENKKISVEVLKDPKLFNPEVPEHLVDFTIQHYEAVAAPDQLLLVHGPIDLAVLERKKTIKWIHSKKCSNAGGVH
jgi:hypothetical protein